MPRLRPDPFRLPAPGWLRPLARLAEKLSGLDALAAGYAHRPAAAAPADFLRFALGHLNTEAVIDRHAWERLPAQGPLILYANHPHGGGEGLLLADLLLRRRPDLRILANRLLCRVPEVAPLILPIDVFRSGVNQGSLRRALRHLEQGGALLVFPAGEVSRWDWRRRAYADPPWQDAVSLLARRSRATLMPVRVGGRAPMLSILVGVLHPRLRTLRLPRDLLALQGQRIRLQLGAPVTPQAFAAVPAEAQTGLLRLLVDQIDPPLQPASTRALAPLVAPTPPDRLADEIAALPPENALLRQGDFEVWCADASRLPLTLGEIGRLRELSFRAMGEGSGQACDLDTFDAHYQHLFVWSRTDRALVGAYRIGDVQAIVARLGVAGLYTHQLFDFGAELPRHLGPALELGRSFVSPAYQRSFQPLRLLWSGIAVLLQRRPALRWLYGPVSVPPGQGPMARALLRDTLMLHHGDPVLARLVRPRQPLRASRSSPERRSVIAGLADPARLSRALSLLDRSRQGLPVLVRQYLELNGRFAGFHVDESFGGSLDGLVFVEVAEIPERVLQRMTRISPRS